MVRLGDELGLYRALNEQGPMTPEELAAMRRSRSATRVNGCPIKRPPDMWNMIRF